MTSFWQMTPLYPKELLFKVRTFKSGKDFLTLAIAVCLKDGAILIADSLQITPFSDIKTKRIVNKITSVTETVGCIEFGVSQITKEVLKQIDTKKINASLPSEILSEIERAVFMGWSKWLPNFSPDVVNSISFKAGLLVAGFSPITSTSGFIGGVLFSIEGFDKPTLVTIPNQCIVLGGEEDNSNKIFIEFAKEELESQQRNFGQLGNIGIRNSTVKAYLEAGRRTIRDLEEKNETIGGAMRYLIIRRGFQPEEGTV